MRTALITSLLAVAVVYAQPQAHVVNEKIHGVVIYSRHGDRQSKVYKGYQVTNLGAQQLYDSGSFYRARYIDNNASHKIVNISSDVVKPSQLWVSGPDQSVLLQTATNFLQGLYPPLSGVNKTLAAQDLSNGTETVGPLDGYQFIQVHAEDDKDPDTIWLKGSDSCPAWTNSSATYKNSTQYQELLASSAPFYAQFNTVLADNLPPNKISYANAYDVFDLLNVAQIHNKSDIVTPEQLDQLRYYANEWEYNMNFNASSPGRSLGGGSLAGGFLKQLNETVATQGGVKFSLMTGSYNTFLAFFGLSQLSTLEGNVNFTGLPNYAASMAFELFSESDATTTAFPAPEDLKVRFLFRNGTDSDDELTAFPLFGQDQLALPYSEFVSKMDAFAITSPKEWCSACGQTKGFCSQPEYAPDASDEAKDSSSSGGSKMSNAVAGVIGAFVTLGVVALVGGLLFCVLRRKRSTSSNSAAAPMERKTSRDRASSTDVPV